MSRARGASTGAGVERLRLVYRVVAASRKLAGIRLRNEVCARSAQLAELRACERSLDDATGQLPVDRFNVRAFIERGRVELERAVQINAALNRKRRALTAERERVAQEMQPFLEGLANVSLAQRTALTKDTQLSRLLATAAENREESAIEEQWDRWRR